jgi:hypothetical protein
MARIRTVKPEFWFDEKLAPADLVTRFVFLGIISMADDFGRLLDNVKQIDAFVFPDTPETSREALANLSRMGRIRRGATSSGQRVIQIVNWEKHQKVDHPNRRAAFPELVVGVEVECVRESVANHSREPSEDVATLSTTNDQRPVPTTKLPRAALKGAESEWDADFAIAWSAFPKRPGNSRADALKAYRARRKDGATAEALLAGVEGYAAYCRREGTEPRFVKQGATFFGPGRHFETDWGPVEEEKIWPYVNADGIPDPDGEFPNPAFTKMLEAR